MTLDLTDDEAAVLARYLRQKLDDERYKLAPRLDLLKTILAELKPPAPQTETAITAQARYGAEPWAT